MEYFRTYLSESESERMFTAFPLIALLIGYSDGEFDKKEQKTAKHIVKVHSYSAPEALKPFYKEVEKQFETLVSTFQAKTKGTRVQDVDITVELKLVSRSLEKLPPKIAYHLYKDFKHYASEIAKSSGGILRFGAINSDESKWLDLHFMAPIEKPKDLLEDPFEDIKKAEAKKEKDRLK